MVAEEKIEKKGWTESECSGARQPTSTEGETVVRSEEDCSCRRWSSESRVLERLLPAVERIRCTVSRLSARRNRRDYHPSA